MSLASLGSVMGSSWLSWFYLCICVLCAWPGQPQLAPRMEFGAHAHYLGLPRCRQQLSVGLGVLSEPVSRSCLTLCYDCVTPLGSVW